MFLLLSVCSHHIYTMHTADQNESNICTMLDILETIHDEVLRMI